VFEKFVPVETAGASALGGLDRLTVEDDHRRAEQAAAAQARLFMKRRCSSAKTPTSFQADQTLLKLGGYAAFLADRAARSFWVQAEATYRLGPI
jgi:hypothetical protein